MAAPNLLKPFSDFRINSEPLDPVPVPLQIWRHGECSKGCRVSPRGSLLLCVTGHIFGVWYRVVPAAGLLTRVLPSFIPVSRQILRSAFMIPEDPNRRHERDFPAALRKQRQDKQQATTQVRKSTAKHGLRSVRAQPWKQHKGPPLLPDDGPRDSRVRRAPLCIGCLALGAAA